MVRLPLETYQYLAARSPARAANARQSHRAHMRTSAGAELIPLPFDWFPPSMIPAAHRRSRLHFVNQAEKGR